MNVSSITRNSMLACAFIVATAAPSWAVPVTLTADFSSPSWSQVHDNPTAGGAGIYKPLSGTLTADLSYWVGGWRLDNIMGVLTDTSGANQGDTVTITDGWLHDGNNEFAHGWFDYSIAGGPEDGTNGKFWFKSNESANSLTETALQLWGGDTTNSLGMDFRADITTEPVPEPSTLFLFASGLLIGLIWLGYRKAQA